MFLICCGFSCVWLGVNSNGAKGSEGAHGWPPPHPPQRTRQCLMWWDSIWGFNWAGWSCWHWQNSGIIFVLSPIWSSSVNHFYLYVSLHLFEWIFRLQLCLKLALLASLPTAYGGLGGRVIYIDVESKFSSKR